MESAGAKCTFVLEQTRGTETSERIIPIATEVGLGAIAGRRVAIIVVVAIATGVVIVTTAAVVVAAVVVVTIGRRTMATDREITRRP